MNSYFYSFLIHFLCFQLLLGPSFIEREESLRRPASSSYELGLEELKQKIEEFKIRVEGRDILPASFEGEENSSLSEEEALMMKLLGESEKKTIYSRKERAFNHYIDSLEGSACGVVKSTEARKSKKKEKISRIEGLIDIRVSQIMKAESEDLDSQDHIKEFKLDDPEVKKLYEQATFLMQELRKYLADNTLSKDERVDLLVSYLGGVALPMRDLIVIFKAYTSQEYDGHYFYESLLPKFSASLIQDKVTKDLIESGPNKLVENFYLEVVKEKWGKVSLRYNKNDVIARDTVSLLKAPTARNYIRASKWMTLQMMLTQVATYDAMMGLEVPIEIPKSCQNSQNGNLPHQVEMQYNREDGDGLLNRILADHGLIYSEGNTDYTEFYYDLANKDPLKESYSGLMPFELYKAAMEEIYHSETHGDHHNIFKSSIDDYESFDQVLEILRPKAMNIFYDSHSWLFGLIDFKDEIYQGAELFDKILKQPEMNEIYEYVDQRGKRHEISHSHQNLSLFLTELMQRHKVSHWEELIKGDLKEKLKKNRIEIGFPSLYGATAWRMWALTQLEEFSKKANPNDSSLDEIFKMAYLRSDHKLNHKKTVKGWLKNLRDYLSSLKVTDDYIPTRRLNTKEHREGYFLLSRLWNILKNKKGALEKAKTDEYEFIKAQMHNGNPWARLRLSYLLLLEELRSIQDGEKPFYSNIVDFESDGNSLRSCLDRDISDLRGRIEKAAKKLGLHRTLVPHYMDGFLKVDERKVVFDSVLKKASPLFKQKNKKGLPYYQDLENVSYQTFLSRDDVEKFVDNKLSEDLQNMAWEGIDKFLETSQADIGRFFIDLYKLRGHPKKQFEYFKKYSQDFGIDNSYSVKRAFLVMDNNLKIHVLKSLLRSSANLRKTKIMSEMDQLCQLNPRDHESFKALFYSTTKAQNQLNQLTGAPTIPVKVIEKIKKKMTNMSSEEKEDMWLGIGSGVLGVGAMLIGGACIGVTGGICAPLGFAMMAAGASAMAMQVDLLTREVKRKNRADENKKKLENLEELGFADRGSGKNFSRSWFWTFFEAISILPLVGVTSRSFKIGAKMTTMFAENVVKQGLREGLRATGRASGVIYSEADVAFSRLILGFDSLSSQGKEALSSIARTSKSIGKSVIRMQTEALDRKVISRFIKRVRNLHKLYAQKKITLTLMTRKIGKIILGFKSSSSKIAKKGVAYTSRVLVMESPDMINKKTAQTVAEYFSHNPKAFYYLMKTYSDKIPRALKAMERYRKGTSFLGKISLFPWIKNGLRSLRSSHLAKYADQILRIKKEAGKVIAGEGNLEKFLLENIDDLTDIFKDIPVRKREIPYMFFIQGAPHWGKRLSRLAGKRLSKSILWDSNGLVMKKFFTARSRLIYESMKTQARTILGLKPFVASETALESFKAFQESVSSVIFKNQDEKGKEIFKIYNDLEKKLSKSIYDIVKDRVENAGGIGRLRSRLYKGRDRIFLEAAKMDESSLRRLVFYPNSEQEKAIGSVLWSSLPVEKLFSLDEIGDVAHRVIRELSQYENVGEYEKLLNAFKVLVIQRDPGTVEIM